MTQIGYYFNMKACVGCRTCMIACKDKNRLDVGVMFRVVDSYSLGTYPSVKAYHYSSSCNHCQTPLCVVSCAAGAIKKEDDGAVIIDTISCIACGECIKACPYSVPKVIDSSGVVSKCDSCVVRREKGENPVCVDACPLRALDFGDLDDLKAKYGKDLVSTIAPLPTSSTLPSILINQKSFATDPGYKWMYL